MQLYDLTIGGYDPYQQSDGWVFDPDQARKPVAFTEKFLSHVKGETGPLILSDWQRVFLANLFGWRSLSDPAQLRYTFALLEIARKNGKSTLVGAVVLTTLFLSPEVGQEIYLAANTREQAGIIFDILAGMIRNNPVLLAKVKILDARKRILFPSTNSFVQCLSSDGFTADGLNASLVVYDELAMAPNRNLFDILKTSQGSRRNPQFVCLSTPGWERESVFHEVHNEGCSVRANEWRNPRFLPAIFTTDPEKDDWRQPETWRKANPNLNVSVREDFIRAECDRAIKLPSYQSAFRRLHCCQWIESATTWLDMAVYRSHVGPLPDLTDATAYGGMDLSIARDLSAFSLVIPHGDTIYCRAWGFLPEANIKDREEQDKKPYRQWAKQGHLILTPGEVVNYDFIREHILELGREYRLKQIGYDKYNASQLTNELEGEGFELVKWSQYFRFMNGPLRELERKLIGGQMKFEPNPLLESCVQNASIETNAEGHIRLIKPQDNRRIDLLVALSMALGLTLNRETYYESPVIYT